MTDQCSRESLGSFLNKLYQNKVPNIESEKLKTPKIYYLQKSMSGNKLFPESIKGTEEILVYDNTVFRKVSPSTAHGKTTKNGDSIPNSFYCISIDEFTTFVIENIRNFSLSHIVWKWNFDKERMELYKPFKKYTHLINDFDISDPVKNLYDLSKKLDQNEMQPKVDINTSITLKQMIEYLLKVCKTTSANLIEEYEKEKAKEAEAQKTSERQRQLNNVAKEKAAIAKQLKEKQVQLEKDATEKARLAEEAEANYKALKAENERQDTNSSFLTLYRKAYADIENKNIATDKERAIQEKASADIKNANIAREKERAIQEKARLAKEEKAEETKRIDIEKKLYEETLAKMQLQESVFVVFFENNKDNQQHVETFKDYNQNPMRIIGKYGADLYKIEFAKYLSGLEYYPMPFTNAYDYVICGENVTYLTENNIAIEDFLKDPMLLIKSKKKLYQKGSIQYILLSDIENYKFKEMSLVIGKEKTEIRYDILHTLPLVTCNIAPSDINIIDIRINEQSYYLTIFDYVKLARTLDIGSSEDPGSFDEVLFFPNVLPNKSFKELQKIRVDPKLFTFEYVTILAEHATFLSKNNNLCLSKLSIYADEGVNMEYLVKRNHNDYAQALMTKVNSTLGI